MIQIARKKPVEVEVCHWTGYNVDEIISFCGDVAHDMYEKPDGTYTLYIRTLEGSHMATPGDYIIKGVKGEFYPCKPDIFAQTYDIMPSQFS